MHIFKVFNKIRKKWHNLTEQKKSREDTSSSPFKQIKIPSDIQEDEQILIQGRSTKHLHSSINLSSPLQIGEDTMIPLRQSRCFPKFLCHVDNSKMFNRQCTTNSLRVALTLFQI